MTLTLTQIRTELLEEHAELRRLVEEARGLCALWRADKMPRFALQRCLQRLATAGRSHNQREELLLRGIVRHVDAWGAVRTEIMDEQHVREHEELSAMWTQLETAIDSDEASAAVLPALDALLGHMDREEAMFLNEKILNDDFGPVDAFGG
jgi:hypothetical protein